MHPKLVSPLLAGLVLMCTSVIHAEMVIVEDGQPQSVIVIPDDAHRTEAFAAGELQKYIEQMSGAQLDVVEQSEAPDAGATIYVGAVEGTQDLLEDLEVRDAEAFTVRIAERDGDGHTLHLLGAQERATLYAVYDFLEQELGCRWLGPGEIWTEVPERPTVTVSAGERFEAPAMAYRVDFSLERFPESTWGMKQKINVARRQIRLPFDWMGERYHEEAALPMNTRGWTAYHTGPVLLRALALDRPEMFSWNEDGARSVASMCFTNPEVRDLMADYLSRVLRERPELDFVELGAVDGLPNRRCVCDRCREWDDRAAGDRSRREGKHTHRWLALVNAVADQLRESDPQKSLMASSYSSYQQPPEPEVITPADNVMITYWTWRNSCRMHAYEHGLNPAAGTDVPTSRRERHERIREWIETWQELSPRGIIVAEYVARSAMSGMTGPQPERFVQDLNYLDRQGVTGYLAFGGSLPWGFFLPNRYATARAAWDPTQNPDELLRDFCDHAFHEASEQMQRLIRTIQHFMKNARCGQSRNTGWMTPRALSVARTRMDAAREAAEGNERVQARLLQFDMHLRYMEMGGPAVEHWLTVLREDRNLDIMRRAVELAEQATEYRAEMLETHGDARRNFTGFHGSVGARLRQHILEGGSWQRLLGQIEDEQSR